MRILFHSVFLVIFSFLVVACGDVSAPAVPAVVGDIVVDPPVTRTVIIEPDGVERPAGTAQAETLGAFFNAINGDTIEFAAGTFNFDTTLVLAHKKGITVKGAGMRQTILSFANSSTPEGFGMSHMDGITIEDLTVFDTPGFSVKISDSDHVTLRNMRTMWSSGDNNMDPNVPSTLDVSCDGSNAVAEGYGVNRVSTGGVPAFPEASGSYVDANGLTRTYVVDKTNGGYAIYPVLSNNVLIDNVVALGASDAGIYVGQSNDIIVKNSEALFNVAGYEIENSDRADVFDSVAHCNTAGFLVFDLPGISQFGEGTRIFNNYAGFNNQENFAPGGIVGIVPQGIGLLQLGYDRVEFFGNIVEFNATLGFVSASHELLEGKPEHPDIRMDLYPEGIHIHDNTFTTNGTRPAPPKSSAFTCAPGTGPDLQPSDDTTVPCVVTDVDDDHPSLLPALVQIKSAQAGDAYVGMGAHIIWDGMYDEVVSDCELTPEFEALVDTRISEDGLPSGKPDYGSTDNPECRYNAYKFDPIDPTKRRHPLYWQCYTDTGDVGGNTFSADSRTFMNFQDTDPTNAPKINIDDHDCPTLFGVQLQPLPAAVVEPYIPGVAGDASPTESEILEVCDAFTGNTVNYAALQFNCPKLSQYNLFATPTDPRSGFNGNGIRYELTTPLFSDYAGKYRVLYLPPGESAEWAEGNEAMPNQTINFPVGSVIAKTFAFKDGGNEQIVETRLLVHRSGDDDTSFWEGLPYLWETDGSGNRTDASLAIGGATVSVSWNYPDEDPDVNKTYVGSSENYSVPHPNQCGSCHNNDDRQAGDAPIGPKIRLMNRPIDFGSGAVNQLANLCNSGRLIGCPDDLGVNAGTLIAENAPRLPRFDVPGDSFNISGLENNNAENDANHNAEVRVRSWLETNCAHCHNRKGLAGSTGLFFDVFRKVDLNYGICKLPNTAGSASDGRPFDLVPGSSDDSIASFRIHSEDMSTQMPPIARSVAHAEARDLIDDWINNILDSDYKDGNCGAP
ncbi:MAG: putative repeat protein (TIGR03806 family) [Pseudoalteromonas tetraodonis]|jgi:uncharacterized repeat protein (TIGR03806 family)